MAQTENGEALIEDGLAVGEKVVVDGQYKLQAGSKVTIGQRPNADTSGKPAAGPKPGGHGEGTHRKNSELK